MLGHKQTRKNSRKDETDTYNNIHVRAVISHTGFSEKQKSVDNNQQPVNVNRFGAK